jgi:hypothetical protein
MSFTSKTHLTKHIDCSESAFAPKPTENGDRADDSHVKQFEIHLRDLKAKIQCKRKTSAEKTPFVISFLCHVTDEYSILSFSFFLVIVSILRIIIDPNINI